MTKKFQKVTNALAVASGMNSLRMSLRIGQKNLNTFARSAEQDTAFIGVRRLKMENDSDRFQAEVLDELKQLGEQNERLQSNQCSTSGPVENGHIEGQEKLPGQRVYVPWD